MITCPADITVDCDSDTSPAITGFATATDNCSQDVIITHVDLEPTGLCPSAFIRVWSATDACGYVATCEQLITLVDDSNARSLNGTVYPNPTRGQVWLEAQMSEGDIIIVRNISGQVIASYIAPSESGLYEVDMNKMSVGVYFIQHTDAEGNFQVHKVIKSN